VAFVDKQMRALDALLELRRRRTPDGSPAPPFQNALEARRIARMRTLIHRTPFEACHIVKLGPIRFRTPWHKRLIRPEDAR
jgi:hypothetical protein